MKRPVLTRHALKEGALWVGAVLGSLCLLLAVLAMLFDVRPLVFRSASMEPAIEAGGLALAREVPASELEVGDIVSVIDSRGTRVTHRIVSLERAGDHAVLTMQGDANASPDVETYRVEEAYRVAVDVPWAGYVVNAAATPWGLLLCGAFVTLLLVLAFGHGHRGSGSGSGAGSDAGGNSTRRGIGAAVAVGALALAVPRVAPLDTMAGFTDSSTVGTQSFTSLAVPGPTDGNCRTSGLLTTSATVSWSSAGPNYDYLATLFDPATGQAVYEEVVTGTSKTYTAGLLSGLFSGNVIVEVRAFPRGTVTWLSDTWVEAELGYGLLGGAYCV